MLALICNFFLHMHKAGFLHKIICSVLSHLGDHDTFCHLILQNTHGHTSNIFMPPTLKKLMGHIAFGGCVRAWVTLFVPTVIFKPLKLES